MKTYIYDWENFDDTGVIHIYVDRDALEMLLEYYNVKIAALVQDKSVDEITENINEVVRMVKERQAIINKLEEDKEEQEKEAKISITKSGINVTVEEKKCD